MARVVIQAVVSVDGYIAYPDDTVGPLFDWYGNGDVTVHVNDKWPFHVSRASADYVQPFWDAIKVTVIGRHLFDTTDGWAGVPAAGDELVVVTHRPLPAEWLARFPDAPFHTAASVAVVPCLVLREHVSTVRRHIVGVSVRVRENVEVVPVGHRLKRLAVDSGAADARR